MDKLKLFQKSIIVVSIPLLIGLSLLAILGYLLHLSELEEHEATHSKAVISEAERLMSMYYDASVTLLSYGLTKSDLFLSRYNEVITKIPEQVQHLNHLVTGDRAESEEMKQIDQLSATALSLMNQTKSALDDESQIDIFTEINNQLRRRTETRTEQLVTEIHKLVEHERDKAKHNPFGTNQVRDVLKLLLIMGIFLNLILTLSLALFFTKGIVGRLGVLTDNSLRLAANRPLNPVLKGGDEIAQLDAVFHSMANTITEAMRKERAIIDNASDVICSIRLEDGCFTSVSPASVAIWGYGPEELIGRTYTDIVTEETRKQTEEAFASASSAQTGVRFENLVRRKNGTTVDILWSAQSSPVEKSIFCVAHDITTRKELDRLKQKFLEMVSHDLRTPLSTTKVFLNMLAQDGYGELPEIAKKRSIMVGSNISRLINMVNNLLDIEKLESDRLSMVYQDCNVETLLERSIEAVIDLAEQKNIRIDRAMSVKDAHFRGDEERLIQVLVNLLSNAVKFAPPDSVVSIKVKESGNNLEFRVSDSGRGVPEQYREIIFDRFQQVEMADATIRGGTGLGLALCRAIVEEHGGSIGVESAEGKGSTFWFKLPRQAIKAET
jgi:PAS domain S-box-containing protein